VREAPTPRVSIGLPVYNGDNFVGQAIESLLAQTYEDIELIVSDNASTDGTEDICRTFAAQDERVRYFRNAENIGLVRNYNQTFTLSCGEYFKWADHDDMCQETFLTRCVQALDENPSVVLAFTRALTIDTDGVPRKQWDARPELSSPSVQQRLRRALKREETFPMCGLIRTRVLKRTGLLGKYPESDIVLLAELSLHGPFLEIPEPLFLLREHPQRTVRTHEWQAPNTMMSWMNPTHKGSIGLPDWGLFGELMRAIQRAPLTSAARWRCYAEAFRWAESRRSGLLRDLVLTGSRVPGFGRLIDRFYRSYLTSTWNSQLHRSAKDIQSLIPAGNIFILVDEAKLPPGVFGDMKTVPFLERDGKYWGVPPDDDTAIRDVERLRQSGASFMVIAWPAFWWLDFYLELNRYLRSRFRCVLQNARLVVFDLRHGPEMMDRTLLLKS